MSTIKTFSVKENGLYVEFRENERHQLELVHFSSIPLEEADIEKISCHKFYFADDRINYPVALQVTGCNTPPEREGNKFTATNIGIRLVLEKADDEKNKYGKKLTFHLKDEETGLVVVLNYQFYDRIPVVRVWTDVTNNGTEPQTLEYVSSFMYSGLDKEGLMPTADKCRVSYPRQSWQREILWQTYTPEQLGLVPSAWLKDQYTHHSANPFSVSNTGNWSTKEYLPMAFFENKESGGNLFWQIEHNGSWHWEISDHKGTLWLSLCGPSEVYAHWAKVLKPGETFTTVPVSVGATNTGFDGAMDALTKYRRAIRRPNKDDENLPVIFNDYMNCLEGDPTTAAEKPLIDAAAKAGCEYYVVDCGWYDEGWWWDTVGEWKACESRFPDGGFAGLMEYIRSKGMVPGLWLELEVMGINCPLAKQVPESWFFQRRGKPVRTRNRYQLDWRNPEVRDFATKTIDRLINDYKIGYIKMDYNIEPGIGTDYQADSPGDGMLEHERAYLAWLESIFAKYPDFVIENCSSGAMRMDYAMLARHSIQSTSDQQDYRNYSVISANCPSALTPEQAAVWSYPQFDGDMEETAFNMVNVLLLRIHQSGHLAKLSDERFSLVKEGLECYKKIRPSIAKGLPFWPLGVAHYSDEWLSMGIRDGNKLLVAVWRKDSKSEYCDLPISFAKGKEGVASCIYPKKLESDCKWNKETGILSVKLPAQMTARLFEIDLK